MSWTTADFRAYPATFPIAHREAAAQPSDPLFLGAYKSKTSAQASATRFRQYRFLIRSHPGVDSSLDKLLDLYDFRTRIEAQALGVWALWLIAKPTQLSELLDLNPELGQELNL